jgi:SAM-dependent methyltransferase
MEPIEYKLMAEVEASLWWYRAVHEWVIDIIHSLTTEEEFSILDVGCGTGGLLNKLSTLSFPTTLIGMDESTHALNYAAGKTENCLVRSTINGMPFKSCVFDIILCIDVLYHKNVEESCALNESCRCLKPGGYLVVHAPAYHWLYSRHEFQVHTKRRYASSTLSQALVNAGFADVEVGYRLGLLFPAMVLSRKIPFSRRSDVHRIPTLIDQMLYGVARLERAIANAGIQLPFGGSVWAIAKKQ